MRRIISIPIIIITFTLIAIPVPAQTPQESGSTKSVSGVWDRYYGPSQTWDKKSNDLVRFVEEGDTVRWGFVAAGAPSEWVGRPRIGTRQGNIILTTWGGACGYGPNGLKAGEERDDIPLRLIISGDGNTITWQHRKFNCDANGRLTITEEWKSLSAFDKPWTLFRRAEAGKLPDLRVDKLPDLNGEWIGEGYTCEGPEKPERIRIEHVGNTVTAVKITGDRCITAGQLTFRGTFTKNPFPAEMQVGAAGESKFFINRTVHVESADLIKLSGSGDPVILRRASKAKVMQVNFVRQTIAGFQPINRNDRGFSELVYNQPFYIEALFDTPPAEIRKEIRLEWAAGQTRNIVVTKTEKDPRVFRSEVLFVKAPQ